MASKLALHIQTPRLDDWRISSISSQVRNGIEILCITVVGPEPEPFGLPAPSLRPPGGMSTAYHRKEASGKPERPGAQRFKTLGRFVGPGRIDFYDPTAITSWTPLRLTLL